MYIIEINNKGFYNYYGLGEGGILENFSEGNAHPLTQTEIIRKNPKGFNSIASIDFAVENMMGAGTEYTIREV